MSGTLEQKRARYRVQDAVRNGKITKPSSCSRCLIDFSKSNIHAHHNNGYENPLNIVWLCRRCHKIAHNELKLSDEQVIEIRNSYSGKWGEKTMLAKKYGVHLVHIGRILRFERRV